MSSLRDDVRKLHARLAKTDPAKAAMLRSALTQKTADPFAEERRLGRAAYAAVNAVDEALAELRKANMNLLKVAHPEDSVFIKKFDAQLARLQKQFNDMTGDGAHAYPNDDYIGLLDNFID